MSVQTSPATQRTAKPVVAGIFNIAVGSCCMLGVLALIIVAAVVAPFAVDVPFNVSWLFALIAVPVAAIGVISLVGGVYELQRKSWGWALAGSITTTIVSNVLGIASIVLTALSRDEFAR